VKKVPKKLRKVLRNLPATNNKRDHRQNIARATGRLLREDFHPMRYRLYGGRW